MAQHTYHPNDRPDVEVLVDGQWVPGELRHWRDEPDGQVANVSWRAVPGQTYISTVPADQVREV